MFLHLISDKYLLEYDEVNIQRNKADECDESVCSDSLMDEEDLCKLNMSGRNCNTAYKHFKIFLKMAFYV
jgi:hypothetical protein